MSLEALSGPGRLISGTGPSTLPLEAGSGKRISGCWFIDCSSHVLFPQYGEKCRIYVLFADYMSGKICYTDKKAVCVLQTEEGEYRDVTCG
ncbi:hypothetical protein D5274_08520 [bacterium 1XD42-94]|nr:hypothetical protein [bacterium 1XD42-76]NBK05191.1 hypothetical protein [bacterium 1XD42-94]